MIEFQHPGWLALLGLAPALWWLHRLRDRGFHHPVAALFLWQPSENEVAHGMRMDKADPAWRRRALLATIAAIAIAGPLLHSRQPPITIWLDDSPSMFADESGNTRMELAAIELVRYADAAATDDIILRSLGDPSMTVRVAAANEITDNLASWRAAAQPPNPPPPALMDKERQHWLVSDGADRQVSEWSANAPLTAIVRVGSDQNNSVIAAITARANPDDARTMDLQVHIQNLSANSGNRTLVISGTNGPAEQYLALEPRSSRIVTATAAMGRDIEARLEPPDALAMDDSLLLTGNASAAIVVRIDADCPQALADAVAAIPGLRPAAGPEQPAGLLVVCADTYSLPLASPVLLFVTPLADVQQIQAPVWSPGAGALRQLVLDEVSGAELAPQPGITTTPLLSSGGRTLMALQQRPQHPPAIHVGLAIDDSGWTRQASFALLVARLAEHVTNRPLLDPLIAARQAVAGEEISPRHPLSANPAAFPVTGSDRDLSTWLILAALLLVLWDLVILVAAARKTLAPASQALQ